MQKLNSSEIEKIQFRRGTKMGQTDEFYKFVLVLSPGEGLKITKEEWPVKTPPRRDAIPKRYRKEGAEYRVNEVFDRSGWVISRVK